MLPAHYSKKETNYFCRFTFGQFFTLLVIEIFTLFFIFYLGARYGDELLGFKQIASAQTTTPQLPPGMPEVTAITERGVVTTQDPEVKAMAKEILNSASTPDLKKRVAEMLEESAANKERATVFPAAPTTAPTAPVTLRTAAPKEESPPPGTVEPVLQEDQAAKSQPVIQTAPHARYTIQVGSYPNVDEAHNIVDQWKSKGYPAFLVSADIPNKGRWYRVRVGGFNSKEAADDFNDKLIAKEQVEAFVVTNE